MFLKNSVFLVVDDSSSIRNQLRTDLNSLGYHNLLEADTAQAAFKAIDRALEAAKPVNLVISDWIMPEISGLEFLRKVRETPQYYHLPFIMLTSKGDVEDVLKALNAGVNGYLIKPHTRETLEACLDSVSKRIKTRI